MRSSIKPGKRLYSSFFCSKLFFLIVIVVLLIDKFSRNEKFHLPANGSPPPPSPSSLPSAVPPPTLLPPAIPSNPSSQLEPTELEVEDLFNAWTTLSNYSDAKTSSDPLSTSNLPIPPHIQDCLRLTRRRKFLEKRQANGDLPSWAIPKPPLGTYRPPWIRGSDEDNLPFTRLVQTRLWQHQFPRDCRDPSLRFAIVSWLPIRNHGLGSALHVLSLYLAVAFNRGRILVPQPRTFQRALHPDCTGRRYGSLECFFFPVTPPACERQAIRLWREAQTANRTDQYNVSSTAPAARILEVQRFGETGNFEELQAPWQKGPITLEMFGEVVRAVDVIRPARLGKYRMAWQELDDRYFRLSWWHSQAVRFLLRHPTESLCQAVNEARHEAYGRQVARQVLSARLARLAVIRSVGRQSTEEGKVLKDAESSFGRQRIFARRKKQKIPETRAARLERFCQRYWRHKKCRRKKQKERGRSIMEASNLLQNTSETSALENSVWWDVEPYLPRPIVSVHVRLGDKANEMFPFSLGTHMWLAERLRARAPNLRNIWLSTEMEDIIEETKNYTRWNFMFTTNMRQQEGERMHQYTIDVGPKELTTISFANLIIASECDFFVGALVSNWPRLINELRSTNGRLKAGMVVANLDEY